MIADNKRLSSFPGAFGRHQILWRLVAPHLPPGELAHDRLHIGRVYHWALKLAVEAQANSDLCGAAALVHDLVPIPKNHPDRSKAGEQSAIASGPLLAESGYSEAEAATIMSAVRTSSWSRGLEPENRVGVVLQDADRLDAIGALGIMRTVACAQFMSTGEKPGRFYHPGDPLGQDTRDLDDKRQATDHFYRKLLKLAEGMRLETAKSEAATRQAAMQAFLAQLGEELVGVEALP
ncbi:MAG: hypothetical protein ACI9OJ_004764 [Myxococcota bacterium]|jgi:uncharacterized protein